MTEIYRVDVEITAPIYDTEVTSRVADAVGNIFPNAEISEEFGEIRAEAHALDHVSELLHQQEILDTARGEFFANRDGQTFSFALKKQAAFEDRINFSVGEPDELGRSASASASTSQRSRSISTTSHRRQRTADRLRSKRCADTEHRTIPFFQSVSLVDTGTQPSGDCQTAQSNTLEQPRVRLQPRTGAVVRC